MSCDPHECFSRSVPSFPGCGAPRPFPGSSDPDSGSASVFPLEGDAQVRGGRAGDAPLSRGEATGAASPELQPARRCGEALASPRTPPPCTRWVSWALYRENLLDHLDLRLGTLGSARAGPPGSVVLGLEPVSAGRICESPKPSDRAPHDAGLL